MRSVLVSAAALSAASGAEGALFVRELRPFVGYAGGASITLQAGTVIEVIPKGSDVQVRASLQGLNKFGNGTKHGFHIHAGSTCDDLYDMGGAHYFEGTESTLDAWLANRVEPDAEGKSVSDVTVSIGLPDPFLLVGKAVVVHDAKGLKAACGLIEESRPGVVFARGAMKPYFDLGTNSPAKVKLVPTGLSNGLASASVQASFLADGSRMSYQATGLASSTSYTLAVLNTSDCICSGSVVSSTFTAVDPTILFKSAFTTSSSGLEIAQVDLTTPLVKANLANRCAVVWKAGSPSTILACGYVVDATKAEGAVDVATVGGTTTIRVWASGLQLTNGVRVGAHVHEGRSCDIANGGHLTLADGTDPYVNMTGIVTVTRLVAKGLSAGAAPYSRTFIEFSHTLAGATALDVAGYTFTIHDTNGNRLTCAELELVDTPQPSAAPTPAVPTTAVPTTAVPTTAQPAYAPSSNAGVIFGSVLLGLGITAAIAYVGRKYVNSEEESTKVTSTSNVESKI
jgi:Cu/Zn superoxide dismutase